MTTATTAERKPPLLKRDARGRERRLVRFDAAEIRAANDDENIAEFTGHAALFDSPTIIRSWGGDFEEVIARGAFKKTIKEADVRFLVNHDVNLLLARNTSGTLDLAEDDSGLLTEARMDRRQTYANDAIIALERGDMSQMSFGFEVVKEEWDFDADPERRTLKEIKLWDVSVVTFPAYTDTDASLRTLGFDALTRDLDSDQRNTLLRSLATGDVSEDIAPILEAAGIALRDMARSVSRSTHSLEMSERRHRHNATRYGLA